MQVDPTKPTLTAPGPQRLKLKFDGLLSIFAFKIKLRCYNKETHKQLLREMSMDTTDANPAHKRILRHLSMSATVGRCRLTISKPVLKAHAVSALETII